MYGDGSWHVDAFGHVIMVYGGGGCDVFMWLNMLVSLCLRFIPLCQSASAPHPSLAPRIQPLYVLNKIVQTGGAFSPEILVAEHAHYNNISPR
ncbi:hypothetical protein EON63_11280 [archaeon]|nr:MAG: hypothetical protein EON63_11280 [archaeon]